MPCPNLGNLDEAMGRESKDWFRVSRSEGARSVDLLDQFWARAGSGEGRIDEERLVRPGEIDGGGQGFFEEGPEIAQPVTFDGDTRRHGMAAALDQKARIHSRPDHTSQVDAGNGAA